MKNLQNQKNNEDMVPIPEKYMLTIREAASYFNIGILITHGNDNFL